VGHGALTEIAAPLTGTLAADDSQRIREHLGRLVEDPLFHNSKRSPAFLSYVVREALSGVPDGHIKERTLGVEVFGRPPNYDTNTDPVVRITAGEVRKRLAQYYYANPHEDVQIEIPLGSYLPRFRIAHAGVADAPANVDPTEVVEALATPADNRPSPHENSKRPPLLFLALALVPLAALAGYFAWQHSNRVNSVDRFWTSFSVASKPVLLVLPALTRSKMRKWRAASAMNFARAIFSPTWCWLPA
jgi:hypothetical protein